MKNHSIGVEPKRKLRKRKNHVSKVSKQTTFTRKSAPKIIFLQFFGLDTLSLHSITLDRSIWKVMLVFYLLKYSRLPNNRACLLNYFHVFYIPTHLLASIETVTKNLTQALKYVYCKKSTIFVLLS